MRAEAQNVLPPSAAEIAEIDAEWEREYEASGALDRDVERLIEQEREDRLGFGSDDEHEEALSAEQREATWQSAQQTFRDRKGLDDPHA